MNERGRDRSLLGENAEHQDLRADERDGEERQEDRLRDGDQPAAGPRGRTAPGADDAHEEHGDPDRPAEQPERQEPADGRPRQRFEQDRPGNGQQREHNPGCEIPAVEQQVDLVDARVQVTLEQADGAADPGVVRLRERHALLVSEQLVGDPGLLGSERLPPGRGPPQRVRSPGLVDDQVSLDGHLNDGGGKGLRVELRLFQIPHGGRRETRRRVVGDDDDAAPGIAADADPRGEVVGEDDDQPEDRPRRPSGCRSRRQRRRSERVGSGTTPLANMTTTVRPSCGPRPRVARKVAVREAASHDAPYARSRIPALRCRPRAGRPPEGRPAA